MMKKTQNKPAKSLRSTQKSSSIVNFDIASPLDLKIGVQNHKGNAKSYTKALSRCEIEVINEGMCRIQKAVDNKKVEDLFKHVTILQIACEMMAAGKAYYACYYIQ